MASATDFWSLAGNRGDFIPSGTKSTTTGGVESTNQTVSQSQSSSQFVSKQNTPSSTLEIIQQLLSQLMDRPAISEAELNAKVPLPRLQDYAISSSPTHALSNSQIVGYDYQRYNRDLARAQMKREQMVKEAGIVPGGTTETRAQQAEVKTEIGRARQQQAGYSKEAAFQDASQLTNRFARQLLEQVMPNITRAVEGSGTSGGVVQGLLSQDAAARVAEAQAALGLETASKYGQISTGLEQILAQLVSSSANTPVLNALMQLLNISKGTIEQGISGGTQTSTQTASSVANKQAGSTEQNVGNPKLQQAQVPNALAGILATLIPGGSFNTSTAGASRSPGFADLAGTQQNQRRNSYNRISDLVL